VSVSLVLAVRVKEVLPLSLQSFPLDERRMFGLICVSEPKAKTAFGTGEPSIDQDSGQPLYVVGLSVRVDDARRAEFIEVTVIGEPRGVTEGTRVRLVGLTARKWEIDGRAGESYRAAAVLPAGSEPMPAPPVKTAAKGGEA
jgi:hypothetical protein